MTLRRNTHVSPTNFPQNHHWVFWAAYHYLYRVSWVTRHHCDRHFSGLGAGDSLLDFGCGTGETTIAMAQVWPHHHNQHHGHHLHHHHHHCEQGVLGMLGNPGKVLGVDISDEMISHCSNHYNGQENLSFQVVFFYIRFGTPFGWWLLNLIQFLQDLGRVKRISVLPGKWVFLQHGK